MPQTKRAAKNTGTSGSKAGNKAGAGSGGASAQKTGGATMSKGVRLKVTQIRDMATKLLAAT